jgi:serine/threonine-protein kinase
MYMMVAGKNPFESESFHSIVSAIIHRDPPRLSAVPDEIWDVIARALAKDPEARYADATELGIALKRASGRTSTTDSGPQSGIGHTPSQKMLVAPLGGDSIVTVPPAGDSDDDLLENAARAPTDAAARRRTARIVIGVMAGAALLALAALSRFPAGSGGTSAPANGSTVAPVVTATATANVVLPVAAPIESALPAVAVPDAGPAKKVGLPPAPPLAAPVKKKEPTPPGQEPSIVRDPGF